MSMQENVSVQIKASLKEKIQALACMERRSLEDETLCLIDNGLAVFETWEKLFCTEQNSAGRPPMI
jgi:hypothetical protein